MFYYLHKKQLENHFHESTHTHKHIFYSDNIKLAKDFKWERKRYLDAIVVQKLIKPILPNIIFPIALSLYDLTQKFILCQLKQYALHIQFFFHFSKFQNQFSVGKGRESLKICQPKSLKRNLSNEKNRNKSMLKRETNTNLGGIDNCPSRIILVYKLYL